MLSGNHAASVLTILVKLPADAIDLSLPLFFGDRDDLPLLISCFHDMGMDISVCSMTKGWKPDVVFLGDFTNFFDMRCNFCSGNSDIQDFKRFGFYGFINFAPYIQNKLLLLRVISNENIDGSFFHRDFSHLFRKSIYSLFTRTIKDNQKIGLSFGARPFLFQKFFGDLNNFTRNELDCHRQYLSAHH